jgi:hypothetical protein
VRTRAPLVTCADLEIAEQCVSHEVCGFQLEGLAQVRAGGASVTEVLLRTGLEIQRHRRPGQQLLCALRGIEPLGGRIGRTSLADEHVTKVKRCDQPREGRKADGHADPRRHVRGRRVGRSPSPHRGERQPREQEAQADDPRHQPGPVDNRLSQPDGGRREQGRGPPSTARVQGPPRAGGGGAETHQEHGHEQDTDRAQFRKGRERDAVRRREVAVGAPPFVVAEEVIALPHPGQRLAGELIQRHTP